MIEESVLAARWRDVRGVVFGDLQTARTVGGNVSLARLRTGQELELGYTGADLVAADQLRLLDLIAVDPRPGARGQVADVPAALQPEKQRVGRREGGVVDLEVTALASPDQQGSTVQSCHDTVRVAQPCGLRGGGPWGGR